MPPEDFDRIIHSYHIIQGDQYQCTHPLYWFRCIRLEQMLPLTLQANIATSFTGLLTSLVYALQVVLCRLFFNITGIIPRVR